MRLRFSSAARVSTEPGARRGLGPYSEVLGEAAPPARTTRFQATGDRACSPIVVTAQPMVG